MEQSRCTVQDAQMRGCTDAAAEDFKCHCNALPALQHLLPSAVLGSDFKQIPAQRAAGFTFCLLGRWRVQEVCDPFVKGGAHRCHSSVWGVLCWREAALQSTCSVKC